MKAKWLMTWWILISPVILTACEPSPKPIQYGHDVCEYCKMMIVDRQYGAELLTQKGKAYLFDSVECLAAFYVKGALEIPPVHSLWVVALNEPQSFIDALEAFYLHSETLRSPMGMNLSAYSTREAAEKMRADFGGEIIGWEGVYALVKESRFGAKLQRKEGPDERGSPDKR